MPTYERETWVDAPLEDVWAFHSSVDGLRALTPGWLSLVVEGIDPPADGDDQADSALPVGTDIRLSVRPCNVGPRQRWVSRIVERERGAGEAHFVDVMREGPFPEWEHTHRFFGDGDRTLVRDHVRYRLPVVALPGALSNLGFEPMFRYRHRRTREILSGDGV